MQPASHTNGTEVPFGSLLDAECSTGHKHSWHKRSVLTKDQCPELLHCSELDKSCGTTGICHWSRALSPGGSNMT